MDKQKLDFNDFLENVKPEYRAFVSEINKKMIDGGFKAKVELKPSGFFASYSHPKTRLSLLNFFFRKSGLYVRIYANHYSEYPEFLDALPDGFELQIKKSSNCKRFINPQDCNPKCVMGYDFFIRGNHYQKCRYNCFQFELTEANMQTIKEFVFLECEK